MRRAKTPNIPIMAVFSFSLNKYLEARDNLSALGQFRPLGSIKDTGILAKMLRMLVMAIAGTITYTLDTCIFLAEYTRLFTR